MLKTTDYHLCIAFIKNKSCPLDTIYLRSDNIKSHENMTIRDNYPFQNKFFIVTVIHEETDLPTCVTVDGIHLKSATTQLSKLKLVMNN